MVKENRTDILRVEGLRGEGEGEYRRKVVQLNPTWTAHGTLNMACISGIRCHTDEWQIFFWAPTSLLLKYFLGIPLPQKFLVGRFVD